MLLLLCLRMVYSICFCFSNCGLKSISRSRSQFSGYNKSFKKMNVSHVVRIILWSFWFIYYVYVHICTRLWYKIISQTEGRLLSHLCPLGTGVAWQTASSVLQLPTSGIGLSLTQKGPTSCWIVVHHSLCWNILQNMLTCQNIAFLFALLKSCFFYWELKHNFPIIAFFLNLW